MRTVELLFFVPLACVTTGLAAYLAYLLPGAFRASATVRDASERELADPTAVGKVVAMRGTVRVDTPLDPPFGDAGALAWWGVEIEGKKRNYRGRVVHSVSERLFRGTVFELREGQAAIRIDPTGCDVDGAKELETRLGHVEKLPGVVQDLLKDARFDRDKMSFTVTLRGLVAGDTLTAVGAPVPLDAPASYRDLPPPTLFFGEPTDLSTRSLPDLVTHRLHQATAGVLGLMFLTALAASSWWAVFAWW